MITILLTYIFVLSIIAIVKIWLELHKTKIVIRKIVKLEDRNIVLFWLHKRSMWSLNEKIDLLTTRVVVEKIPTKKSKRK